jgi:hypothetical protein
MIRTLVAATALLAASPAAAAPADPAAALAFAHAWLDPDTINLFSRDALRLKLERCVKSGSWSEEQLAASQPALDVYLTTFLGGLGRVQQQIANKAAQVLSNADLRQLATTFGSPLFRQLRKQVMVGMAQTLVPRLPGCGDESRPIGVSEFGATMAKRLTPAQYKKLAAFAMSPAGQHFNRALPELNPVMLGAMRAEAANAIKTLGGTEEMQDKIRRYPSPFIMDAPPPLPPKLQQTP